MSKCNFNVPLNNTADAVVEKLRSRITAAKGSFDGDSSKGNFVVQTPLGAVHGNYTVAGETLNVDITDKPMFVPCDMIEGYLQKELA
ncbi:hypothetical protein SAMN05421788_112135 [Filimonas lacunae]|uniref:Uncharacterized protein n=1 Tax=Filimonas lacunae TaxID=477680 RepID=A0A173MLG3_9BACT|nr:hypothetical protein [Filimonas lacunae]BAV08327.1 hypothetical protein FLA_4363 [Filimonas lacunae]SIT33372.1 hypothetical protein SAMN05421788_112135 [Filimonas lacunae]